MRTATRIGMKVEKVCVHTFKSPSFQTFFAGSNNTWSLPIPVLSQIILLNGRNNSTRATCSMRPTFARIFPRQIDQRKPEFTIMARQQLYFQIKSKSFTFSKSNTIDLWWGTRNVLNQHPKLSNTNINSTKKLRAQVNLLGVLPPQPNDVAR